MRKIKIALYQSSLKGTLPKKILCQLQKAQPDFFILPEYFFFKPLLSLVQEPEKYSSLPSENRLKLISQTLPNTIIVGGSMITRRGNCFYNTCMIFKNGIEIGRYDKQRLFEREIGKLCTGAESRVFELDGIRFSVLICADVLDESNFKNLAEMRPHFIFVPTFSPYKQESVEIKIRRDEEIFVKGSQIADSIVIKVCGVPDSKKTYSIQGRSLIANSEKVLWRTPFHMEHKEILKIGIFRLEI